MPAATESVDRPARVQVVATWTGGQADLLRQSMRMTNESFAEYLGVVVRTVANWRERPEIIPRAEMQESLDTALERAPERAKALFTLLVEHGKWADCADSLGMLDLHGSVADASSPLTAQAIPGQRIPPDDVDDVLAHLMVTSIGEDVIQQI